MIDDSSDDDERRDRTRTRILRSAKIIVPRRSSVVHCTVQNIPAAELA